MDIPELKLGYFQQPNVDILSGQSNRQFPSIIQWLKNQCIVNTNFIRNFTGDENYKRFNAKFMQKHKPTISSIEFAEMFWNECQVMRITSMGDERKTVEGYINAITNRYEDEQKKFNERLAEEKRINNDCHTEIESYFNLLDIKVDEIKNLLPFPDGHGYVMEAFQEFKKIVYAKYRRIYLEPHTEDDLIAIIQAERTAIQNKVRAEYECRESALLEAAFGDHDDVDEMPPRTYTKHGFYMPYKELMRAAEEKSCSICTVEYTQKDMVIFLNKCKHTFHKECIEKWDKKTCPICRAED